MTTTLKESEKQTVQSQKMYYQNIQIKTTWEAFTLFEGEEDTIRFLGWPYVFKRTKHITGGYETCRSKMH